MEIIAADGSSWVTEDGDAEVGLGPALYHDADEEDGTEHVTVQQEGIWLGGLGVRAECSCGAVLELEGVEER